jgi:hypothetical protein
MGAVMSVEDRSFSEKRNFIRMKINTPVIIHYEDKSFSATCKNLSGAGMLLETEAALNPGDELHVSIEQKAEKSLPFSAIVEVTRVKPEQPGVKVVGLVIKELLD